MRRSRLERIRERIRLRQYDMAAHASDKMAEEDLSIIDVERAVLTGRVVRIQKDDPRGNKYVLEGTGTDGTTLIGVVGRFPSMNRYLIVTVYRVTGG